MVTLVSNISGASTEVVRGFIYRVNPSVDKLPAFVNTNGYLAASYIEESFRPNAIYTVHMDSTVGATHKTAFAWDLPLRNVINPIPGYGRMAPRLSTSDRWIFSSPTIAVNPTSIAVGGTVTVTVASGPGSTTDWVALYAAGATNDYAYIGWQYLNGSQTAPKTGLTGQLSALRCRQAQGSTNFTSIQMTHMRFSLPVQQLR